MDEKYASGGESDLDGNLIYVKEKTKKTKLRKCSRRERSVQSAESITHIEINGEKSSPSNERNSSVCVDLKIDLDQSTAAIELNEVEIRDIIFKQMSNQVAKMTENKILFDETERVMEFELNDKVYELDILKVNADGSCLYRAADHQMSCEKLNGTKQSQNTDNLRANVIAFIKSNYEKFEYDLKGRLFFEEGYVDATDEQCNDFIYNKLPKKSTWGGGESMKAITLLYSVNILIFNEYEKCFFLNGFDPSFNETIFLAYRTDASSLLESSKQINRNHYDSVVCIEVDSIFEIAEQMAKYYMNRTQIMDTSHITIDNTI